MQSIQSKLHIKFYLRFKMMVLFCMCLLAIIGIAVDFMVNKAIFQ